METWRQTAHRSAWNWKRNIFAQWRVSHCGKHDRLRDLRLTERRTDVQWLIWVVFGSVDSWWDLLCVRGALLCWTRDHHLQVGCQLCLYPGGFWRLFGFHPSMDFSSDHRAHQSGCDSHHLLQLHGAAHLPHVYSTLCGQSSAGCSLHMWVNACGCVYMFGNCFCRLPVKVCWTKCELNLS